MTTKHYAHLGKILCAEHPELAAKLNEKLTEETPVLADVSLLPKLLDTFCQIKSITLESVSGKELADITMNKHLFVALVLKFYSPATLTRKEVILYGLGQELSSLLNTRNHRISRIVNNVRFYLTIYKSFAKEVLEIHNQINQLIIESKWN